MQPQIEANGNLTHYLEGAADAAMGLSPSSKDPNYIEGYVDQLKTLILTSPATLVIRWLSDAYQSGGYDAPDYSDDPF